MSKKNNRKTTNTKDTFTRESQNRQNDNSFGKDEGRQYKGDRRKSGKYNPGKNKASGKSPRQEYASDSSSMEKYIGASNDIKWYNKNERLIHDVSKIPFGYQLGKKIPEFSRVDGTYSIGNTVVPGIFTLDMLNVPGVATNSSDGVNLAATGLLQYVRKHLSTVGNYAAADLMMYVLGIDDIYSDFANITRLFGILNTYSAVNMYLPKHLVYALYHFSDPQEFDNIIAHMNDYRARFNNLIFKASTLYLPTDFTITERHSWLYMNTFTDAATTKAQLYGFTKAGGYILDETSSTQGTQLTYTESADTMDGLLDDFAAKIDAYRNSDSMMKIAADMRRAFDGRQKWAMFYIDENWMSVPGYDKTVLMQIHNTLSIPYFGSWINKDITQSVNKNIIHYQPKCILSKPDGDSVADFTPLVNSRIFNYFWDNVTEDEIIESTRNQPVIEFNPGTNPEEAGSVVLGQCGADICVGYHIWTIGANDDTSDLRLGSIIYLPTNTTAKTFSAVAQFDWAPIMYCCQKATSGVGANEDYTVLADLANYTVISPETLSIMHSNVICSMYAIPEFGGFDA